MSACSMFARWRTSSRSCARVRVGIVLVQTASSVSNPSVMFAEAVRVGGVVTSAELVSDRLPRVLARYPVTTTLAVPEPLRGARTMLAVPDAYAEAVEATERLPRVLESEPVTRAAAVEETVSAPSVVLSVPVARAEAVELAVSEPSVMLAVAVTVPPPPPSSRPKTSTAPSSPTSDLSSEVAMRG